MVFELATSIQQSLLIRWDLGTLLGHQLQILHCRLWLDSVSCALPIKEPNKNLKFHYFFVRVAFGRFALSVLYLYAGKSFKAAFEFWNLAAHMNFHVRREHSSWPFCFDPNPCRALRSIAHVLD